MKTTEQIGLISRTTRRVAATCGLLAMTLLVACAPAAQAPAQKQPATTTDSGAKATDSGAKPAAKALSRTNATVATVSNSWTVLMVPYIALDKGYWREAGLTGAEVKVVGPGATHVAAVLGGSIDYSVNLNTEGTVRANATGDKIYGIAGSTNKPNYALYAKGVERIEDLRGKAIATDTPGGAAESITIEILEAKGIKRSEVTLVPVAGTIEERVRAMLTGAASAALGSIADWPTLKTEGVQILGTLEDVYPDFQFALTVSRGEMVENHPDTTVAFLKGMIRGFQYVQDPANDEEIKNILKAHDIRVDDENWTELIDIQRKLMTTDGSVNVKGTQVVAQRLIEAGQVPADYKVEQLLRLSHLEQAQQELGIK